MFTPPRKFKVLDEVLDKLAVAEEAAAEDGDVALEDVTVEELMTADEVMVDTIVDVEVGVEGDAEKVADSVSVSGRH